MESIIIKEMQDFIRLGLNPKQEQYLTDTIAVAKRVEIVRAADVFSDYELKIIRDVLKPPKSNNVIVMRICFANCSRSGCDIARAKPTHLSQ